MSFQSLKKDKLLEAAEYFGVDFKKSDTKATLAATLADNGVTFAEYERLLGEKTVAVPENQESDDGINLKSAPVPESGQLVKMTRANASFEIRGYKFTREHPFAIVGGGNLDYLLEQVDGFRLATPAEVKSYYN